MLELHVNEGREHDVEALMTEMVASTETNEPGTMNYEWSFSADGRICHLYERYRDSEAAMVHGRTFGEKFASRFFDVFTPTRFTFYGSPSDDVRELAAPFNPVVMKPAAGVTRLA
jgi:quinol monooxygenase YgiN